MAFYTGVFNTTQNPTELNKRSFASHILLRFPNGSAPIFALTSQTGRSRATSSTHGYFSKTLTFAEVQINQSAGTTGYDAAATTLVVDSTTGIQANMVLHNKTTKENMRVTAVGSSTQITVTRAFGRVSAGLIADNQVLVCIGYAFAEGSARPEARGITTTYVANYTQIFRTGWALTDTARASLREMGVSNAADTKKDAMLLHAVDIEAALLFGQPKMDTSGTQPLHATQGIIDAVDQYASGNATTASATTSYSQLVTMMEPAFAYSTDLGEQKARTLFGGSTAIKVINDIARKSGVVQIQDGQTNFGLHFTKFSFYKGVVYLLEHPLLNGITGMAGTAVVVDMPALKLAYMDGRDARVEEFGGSMARNNANGVDSEGGTMTSELAVELLNPYGCVVIRGLTAGVADS